VIWELLKLFGREVESLLHKVSVWCLCAQITVWDLALGAECGLDCPVCKHAVSESCFAWNYISQSCHWHEQMNVCCTLTDTIPRAIIVCETVSWCGIEGSDKHTSI